MLQSVSPLGSSSVLFLAPRAAVSQSTLQLLLCHRIVAVNSDTELTLKTWYQLNQRAIGKEVIKIIMVITLRTPPQKRCVLDGTESPAFWFRSIAGLEKYWAFEYTVSDAYPFFPFKMHRHIWPCKSAQWKKLPLKLQTTSECFKTITLIDILCFLEAENHVFSCLFLLWRQTKL